VLRGGVDVAPRDNLNNNLKNPTVVFPPQRFGSGTQDPKRSAAL
jgi:hypothetical protein